MYSFLLRYQTSSSRRSSLSSLPQPLLNAVRQKQESVDPFPVTWAQKVASNCCSSPTKRPLESRQRVVSPSSASSLQRRPNNNPWCASASFQSDRGLYFKLVSTQTLRSKNSLVVRSSFGRITNSPLNNLVRSSWLDVGLIFSFLLTLTLGEYRVYYSHAWWITRILPSCLVKIAYITLGAIWTVNTGWLLNPGLISPRSGFSFYSLVFKFYVYTILYLSDSSDDYDFNFSF